MKRAKQDCNIGPEGIARRRKMAYISTLIAIVYALAIWYFAIESVWRIPIFIPVFFAAIGYLQAWLQFCVRFGFTGKNTVLDNETVAMQPDFHIRKSQWRALRITLYAIIIAAFVTTVVYYQ